MKRTALLLLALILVPQVFSMVAETSGAVAETEGSSFRISYTATLVNIDSTMDRVVVYLPIPREWDSQKSVQIESITPKPFAINEDPDYGNRMAYFLLPNGIPRNQSREFTVQYTFTFYQTHVLVDPAKVRSYNTSDSNYVKYTRQRPSDWVESDDPTIKKTASDVVGSESNPYRKAKLIYDWMVTNIEYKFPSPWGAKQTYLKRGGDCGSQTALFCAMAISQGIPCRAISGLIFSSPFPRTYTSKGSPSTPAAYGSHVYAEFYLPIYGWVPADTSIGRGSGRPEDYFSSTWDFFSIRSKGFGIQMVPPIPERVWLFPHYTWWFWGDARKYDSYYTYRVEKMEATRTTTAVETTTLHVTSYEKSTSTPATRTTTESILTFTTGTAPSTALFPTRMSWLQTEWPYLVLTLAVATIAVVFVARRLRSRSQ